jgi:hypothetical protein
MVIIKKLGRKDISLVLCACSDKTNSGAVMAMSDRDTRTHFAPLIKKGEMGLVNASWCPGYDVPRWGITFRDGAQWGDFESMEALLEKCLEVDSFVSLFYIEIKP